MRSMTRLTVAGCMTLAALSAVAVLDVGFPAAEAAPAVSPFAGSYVGYVPGTDQSMPVTISDTGRIASPWSDPDIDGRVSADGSYSFTTSGIAYYYNHRTGHTRLGTFQSKSYGIMALDLDGNIVATSNRDTSGFVWLRQ